MIKYLLIVCASTSCFSLLSVMQSASLLISVVKQSQHVMRSAITASCHSEINHALTQTGFVSACGKLANRILTRAETVNWHMTPYSLLQEHERKTLEDIFSDHMQHVDFKKMRKIEADFGRNMPFSIEYADHGMQARLTLTLFDIFKQEHAHYNVLLESPHIRESFERQRRDRLKSLVLATSYSVRLLDVALQEAAQRIDDM